MAADAIDQNVRRKHRRFRLSRALDERQTQQLQTMLAGMMGVEEVSIYGNEVEITYDLLQCTARQVVECLKRAAVMPGHRWVQRLKNHWVHYTEENELDHLAAGDSACCNQPPPKG